MVNQDYGFYIDPQAGLRVDLDAGIIGQDKTAGRIDRFEGAADVVQVNPQVPARRRFIGGWPEQKSQFAPVKGTGAVKNQAGEQGAGRRRAEIEGYQSRRGEDLSFMFNVVGPDYFRTLRIHLVAGRGFEQRDDEHAAGVAVVSRALAERTVTCLVVPNDVPHSWIVEKVTQDAPGAPGNYGFRMPLGAPVLCADTVATLESWINRGAPND